MKRNETQTDCEIETVSVISEYRTHKMEDEIVVAKITALISA